MVSPRVRSRPRAPWPPRAPGRPPGTIPARTARGAHGQLPEQEAELLLERRSDRGASRRRQAPQLPLVHAERLLARLVEELLVRVARLALVGGRAAQALVDVGPARGG